MSPSASASDHFRFHERAESLQLAKDASFADSALIVIDAQNFYLEDADFPVAGIRKTNKVIADLVEKYRAAGGPIVWVAHTYDNKLTHSDIVGTPLDINDDIGFSHEKQHDNELFLAKAYGSSFLDTPLDNFLKKKDIKKIVLCGYQPQFCIVTTAVYGHHLGYNVFVVRDAIGSHNLKSWDDKRDVKGEDLVDSACDLLGDVLARVIMSEGIHA